MTVPRVLEKALETDRLASSYLFYGRAPERFRDPIVDFLKGILCREEPGLGFCDGCPDCVQSEHLNHPDVTATGAPGFEGEVGPDDRIGVDTVRNSIVDRSTLTPARSDYKLFWLHDMTRFTPEASNTLLKVLEEPPGNTVFLLTSRSRWDCLPTIRSRCQWIRVPGDEPDHETLEDHCKYHWEEFDVETLEKWLQLLNGQMKSREFNWSRESARRFLEFLLLVLDEQYRDRFRETEDPLLSQCPEDRLSYALIPDILQRLEELERGGHANLVVNSLLETIFFPGADDEWIDAI